MMPWGLGAVGWGSTGQSHQRSRFKMHSQAVHVLTRRETREVSRRAAGPAVELHWGRGEGWEVQKALLWQLLLMS